eukprot:GABV01000391.1.p1 GENE.GABV01000391.1~~GABV01000391.1.p1  ORF type:complete len:216 (-),score=50.66 GABV01000391.1:539-1186(-)
MNAALQALMHCRPFVRFFSTPEMLQDNPNDAIGVVKHMAELTRKVWKGPTPAVSPVAILRDIWRINPNFRGYAQQDSQEFIRCLLDTLHEALKGDRQPDNNNDIRLVTNLTGERPTHHRVKSSNPRKRKRAPDHEKFGSIVSDIFQGILHSEIQCTQCQATSITENAFYDLSLEIPVEKNALQRVEAERDVTPMPRPGIFRHFCKPLASLPNPFG